MSNITSKTNICEFCGSEFIKTCLDEAYLGNHCFDCSFWLKKITMLEEDENRRVIVNGQHYMVGANTSGPLGFGGRKYTILFNDGRTIETRNLWFQGKISEKFRDRLPDNAKFIPSKGENENV